MVTARHRHLMPYGAQRLDNGSIRFRLWAPAAKNVDVCLSDQTGQTILPMVAETEGWFNLITNEARIGSHYRFRINSDEYVPDPASRFQPQDVHAASEVIDHDHWEWHDADWKGRPWEEAIIYELHVGSFTPEGDFAAVQKRLDYLVNLGITAIELMPIADFPRSRNWGYDGVYLFAPDSQYGRPEDLKALIDAAHAHGLMVFLDVVYNHFGPDGNYLAAYAPQFFTNRHHTPWGAALNYDGENSHWVRQFFIHNALYWLEEYHIDGLRLDAVHTMLDDSQPDILTELANQIRIYFSGNRHIHLILENDDNAAHYLACDTTVQPQRYTAQWNDDLHHVLHVLLTGETNGYYRDYADTPIQRLGRCLTEGFAYQGERSIHRGNKPRGEPSAHLPVTAFVSFLQNHDQVGNRAFGERLSVLTSPESLRAATVILLLAPSPPLLFMGQEWGSQQPFFFFCDYGPELADKIVAGRRQEFTQFPAFKDPAVRQRIPSPIERATYSQSVLDWHAVELPTHKHWLMLHRELIALRRQQLTPRLANMAGNQKDYQQIGEKGLFVHWVLGDSSDLSLVANLGNDIIRNIQLPSHDILYATHPTESGKPSADHLPPWSVTWYLYPHAQNTAV